MSEQTDIKKREVGEKIKLSSLFEAGKTKDLGDGIVEAIVTTPSTDRHMEQIKTEGIEIEPYLENPVVLYGHDYEALPIGKTLSLKRNKNKLTAKFQFAIAEYPFAKTVYELVKGGYLNDVSIGGIVKKWSEDYQTIEELEMIEFSVVNIGANRDAKIIARGIGKSVDDLREEYQQFVHKNILDKMKGMGDDEIKDAIKVLKNLLARLEESAQATSSTDAQEVKRIRHIVLRDARALVTQGQKVIKTIKLKS